MNEQQAVEEIIKLNKEDFHKGINTDNLYISDELIELKFSNQIYDSFDDLEELLYDYTNLLFSWSFSGSMYSSTSSVNWIDNGKEILHLQFIDDLRYVIAFSSKMKKSKPHHDFLNLLFHSNGKIFNTQLLSYELPKELLIGKVRIKQLFKQLFIKLIIDENLWHKIPIKIIDENAPDIIPQKFIISK